MLHLSSLDSTFVDKVFVAVFFVPGGWWFSRKLNIQQTTSSSFWTYRTTKRSLINGSSLGSTCHPYTDFTTQPRYFTYCFIVWCLHSIPPAHTTECNSLWQIPWSVICIHCPAIKVWLRRILAFDFILGTLNGHLPHTTFVLLSFQPRTLGTAAKRNTLQIKQ